MSQVKILIVGDEAFAANKLVPGLLKRGYAVSGIATSGGQALEEIKKVRPDVVLMEIPLQGEVDGIETAERLFRDFHLPVIFLAENDDVETLNRAKIAEPFGYLKKPIRVADLASAITIGLYKNNLEHKSQEQQTWLQVAMDCAGEGVIVTDASGQIRHLNQLARQILSLPDATVVGQRWSDVVHLQSKITGIAAGDLVQLAILQGTTFEADEGLVVVTSSGEKRDVEGEVALCKVKGEINGAIFTFRDVTLRNREEERVRQELRGQANAQLVGSISSEVNSLLQAALQHNEEALAGIETGHAARGSIEALKTRVEDLSRIARQLFTLNSNTVSFPSILDLNAIVSESCAALRKILPPETALVTDLSPDLAEIRADASLIGRAITLLATHASKGLPKDGEIKIKTRNYAFDARSRGGEIEGYVILTIHDTGPGMRQEEARRLFDPSSQSAGSGALDLGLFVVQGIIADARGSISVTSNPGEGTTFEILLPQTATSGESAPASGRGAYSQGSEAALLLVEADPSIRNLVANRLENEGYELLGACNPAEAMGWVDTYEGPIAVLVTNLVMPDISGTELAQRILLRYPHLVTVFMFDQPVDPSLEKTWTRQGAAFLAKPFGQEELVRLVRGTLNPPQMGESSSLGLALT